MFLHQPPGYNRGVPGLEHKHGPVVATRFTRFVIVRFLLLDLVDMCKCARSKRFGLLMPRREASDLGW